MAIAGGLDIHRRQVTFGTRLAATGRIGETNALN